MYVSVSRERLLEETFNASQLNFTWHTVSFDGNKWTVQIDFENPLKISTLIEQD